jgi:DGQHR domain-containing protein
MAYHRSSEPQRFSVSLVTQGRHRFYTLTLPSDILANTSFVTSRDEDPKAGFQRVLDKKRAQQIAEYIDVGLGTIPTSVILSAQKAAELEVIGKGKTLQFRDHPKAFLVLDGQHRVYGFSLAKTSLRVPVVIYNNLSPRDESRLFIDINTKQRPVPNELLLDIKKLAEYETGSESLIGEVFDRFHSTPESALIGLMSPHERTSAKISRVTFNAGLKPLLENFAASEADEIFGALNSYLTAFIEGTKRLKAAGVITKSTVFRAAMLLFKDAAQRVQDRYGKAYTAEHFTEVLQPMFARTRLNSIKSPGNSPRDLYEEFAKALKVNFTL